MATVSIGRALKHGLNLGDAFVGCCQTSEHMFRLSEAKFAFSSVNRTHAAMSRLP
jgi:hypothetical protein